MSINIFQETTNIGGILTSLPSTSNRVEGQWRWTEIYFCNLLSLSFLKISGFRRNLSWKAILGKRVSVIHPDQFKMNAFIRCDGSGTLCSAIFIFIFWKRNLPFSELLLQFQEWGWVLKFCKQFYLWRDLLTGTHVTQVISIRIESIWWVLLWQKFQHISIFEEHIKTKILTL